MLPLKNLKYCSFNEFFQALDEDLEEKRNQLQTLEETSESLPDPAAKEKIQSLKVDLNDLSSKCKEALNEAKEHLQVSFVL